MCSIKMFVISVILFCLSDRVLGKNCSECVSISLCPEALSLLPLLTNTQSKTIITKLRQSFCGFKNLDGKSHPMVCCSDFNKAVSIYVENDTEKHHNIALLPTDCGVDKRDHIIRGEFASLYDYPWMALINVTKEGVHKSGFICGGTIISSRYVLTAAHCIKDKIITAVRIGEHDVATELDCEGDPPDTYCGKPVQDIRVEKTIIHPEYEGSPTRKNDIGLLRLQKEIDFSFENAGPICLPLTNTLQNLSLDGKSATIAGWGFDQIPRASSSRLRQAFLPISDYENCSKLYDRYYEGNICVGTREENKCIGDGGSPLMLAEMYNGYRRIIQFGVLTFGPTRCNSKHPDVYLDVRRYLMWILDSIKA